ncbi:unnamed protein product [Mycetohabitans rhizoxinica HKI 454]|uniref:Uncharacterized protein n=1 Tax=Mycetohabitans rhizoxinica (strain DSM 19002 / CIP 109453 / HKI 454) TaxID=882378 RepID=E5AP87_MYCRK|nr:unnamed protein product [Mycetohabitans rhizoxinica HKI 454]
MTGRYFLSRCSFSQYRANVVQPETNKVIEDAQSY